MPLEVDNCSSQAEEKLASREKRRSKSQENGKGKRRSAEKEQRQRSKGNNGSDKLKGKSKKREERRRPRGEKERSKDDRSKRRTKKPTNGKDESTSKTNEDAISLEQISALLERLHDPSIVKRVEAENANAFDAESDLTRIPWSMHLDNDTEETQGSESTCISTNRDKQEKTGAHYGNSSISYPPWSYLDLRRQQNTHWATRRLEAGVKFAKESKWRQAEACYKEGLDLVPNHAELQVAYGALCANTGRKQLAIQMLERVVKEFPGVANAHQYLDAIRNNGKAPTAISPKKTAAETALRDALAERAFLAETPAGGAEQTSNDKSNTKYPILPLDDEERSLSSRDSSLDRRKKRKHRRYKERRRSHHHHDSRSHRRKHRRSRSPSYSDSSGDHRRHKRLRRYRHRSPSLSDSDVSRRSHHGRRRSSLPAEGSPDNGEDANQRAKPDLDKDKPNLDREEPDRKRDRDRSASLSISNGHRRRRHHRRSSPSPSASSSRRRRRRHDKKRDRRHHRGRHKKKKKRARSMSDSDRSEHSGSSRHHSRRHSHHSRKGRERGSKIESSPRASRDNREVSAISKDPQKGNGERKGPSP